MTEQPKNEGYPELAAAIREARKKAGLSQLQLSRRANVSPKTIANLEEFGVARFDPIARLAITLAAPVDQWLALGGHNVQSSKLEDVIEQAQTQRIEAPFPELTIDEHRKRTIQNLFDNGQIGLRCTCVFSPVNLSPKGTEEYVLEALKNGLHYAMISPFPTSVSKHIEEQSSALLQYYMSVYNWAREAAQEFIKKVPEANGRVHLFTPKVRDPNVVIPVCPPTGIHEIRPTLTQYGCKPHAGKSMATAKLPTRELTAYCHSLDNRPDHWSDIYSDDQPNPRGRAACNMWYDYLRDILDAWQPEGRGLHSKATYSLTDESLWELRKI